MTAGFIKRGLLALLLAGHSLAASASGDTQAPQVLFEQLLMESGLQLTVPAGFTDNSPVSNPVLPYEHALKHVSGGLEIRYIIRPLGRLSIDYNDPHNAAPEPNHLFPLLFESLYGSLSSGGNTPNREYSQMQAWELFNAGWASAVVFDVNPDFSNAWSQALMIGIHKDGQADAYTVFLYNDYAQAKEFIQGAISSLSFEP